MFTRRTHFGRPEIQICGWRTLQSQPAPDVNCRPTPAQLRPPSCRVSALLPCANQTIMTNIHPECHAYMRPLPKTSISSLGWRTPRARGTSAARHLGTSHPRHTEIPLPHRRACTPAVHKPFHCACNNISTHALSAWVHALASVGHKLKSGTATALGCRPGAGALPRCRTTARALLQMCKPIHQYVHAKSIANAVVACAQPYASNSNCGWRTAPLAPDMPDVNCIIHCCIPARALLPCTNVPIIFSTHNQSFFHPERRDYMRALL
jgi:hypothetical protein